MLSSKLQIARHSRTSIGQGIAMTAGIVLKDIAPKAACTLPTAAQMVGGIPIPPVRIIQVMSESDWEEFTEEALSHLKARGDYEAIRRAAGAGDLGLDVVAFTSES